MYTDTYMEGGNHNVPTYFDKRHTWEPNIAHQRGKLDKSCRVRVSWLGQHRELMSIYSRQGYQGTVRPSLEYNSSA